MKRLILAAVAALALVAQSSRADDFCTGVNAALAQPHGFDSYKGAPIDEDETSQWTDWSSPVRLVGARDCTVTYDKSDKDTTYSCEFSLPEGTAMADFQAAYFDRVAACVPGIHGFHYDGEHKRVDYLGITAGTVIIADNSVNHQTLTLMVQQVDMRSGIVPNG